MPILISCCRLLTTVYWLCKMWNHSKRYCGHGVTEPEFRCSVFTFQWLTEKHHITYHMYVWLFLKSLWSWVHNYIRCWGCQNKSHYTYNMYNNCNSLAQRYIASSTREIALVGNYVIRPLLWQVNTAFCHKHSDLLLFNIHDVKPAFHVCWGVDSLF